MPINTIILAVLGLVILVILLYMTGYRLQLFGGTLADCEAQSGKCVAKAKCDAVESSITIKGTKCPTAEPVCCKALIPQPVGANCASDKDCASGLKCSSPGNTCA